MKNTAYLCLIMFTLVSFKNPFNKSAALDDIFNKEKLKIDVIDIYGSWSGKPLLEVTHFKFKKEDNRSVDIWVEKEDQLKHKMVSHAEFDTLKTNLILLSKRVQPSTKQSYSCTSHYQKFIIKSKGKRIEIGPMKRILIDFKEINLDLLNILKYQMDD